jgi:hypothetical protein
MTTTAGFLIEGAKSYIDALVAITAFESAVRAVCKDVYDKYKPQLVSRIGLEDAQCEDHENKQPENRLAELGVRQDSPSGRESFYVYLKWDGTKDGAPEISAELCLEFSKKSDRNDYAKLLRKLPSRQLSDDSGSPYLWSSKKLSDLSSCAEALDELLNEWLACWPAGRRLE